MELSKIILRLDELKEALDELRPLREDRLNRLTQKLKLDWNYHSNSIEGNTLSMSETKSFILWGVTAKGKPFRDYLEMKGHNDALNKLYQIIDQDLKITESLIQAFHKIILVEPYTDRLTKVNPGHWKTVPNYLYSSTGERIDFAAPEDVPKLMNSLINWLNNHIDPPKRKKKKYDLHPLLITAGFHTQFIKIHPFGDGNGRMARILTNLILMLCGYLPTIVKLDDRVDYYTSINTSSLDSPENLAIFLGQAAIESLELAIKAAKGEPIEKEDDLDKELKLIEQKLKSQTINTPLKSVDRVFEIIAKNSFPFFDKLILKLSKFDDLFESVSKTIYLNGDSNNKPTAESKKDILELVTKTDVNNLFISYSFKELKNNRVQVGLTATLKFEFQRGGYIISDNMTNQKKSMNYNQSVSIEEQKERIENIQKALLIKIKNIIK